MTAADLTAFLRVFLNKGEPLLTAESFELMSRPAAEMGEGWSYGYGLFVGTRDGRRVFGHGGSMPGFGPRCTPTWKRGSASPSSSTARTWAT